MLLSIFAGAVVLIILIIFFVRSRNKNRISGREYIEEKKEGIID